MALDVEIKKKLEHFRLDVAFSCGKGRILSIIGPSGSGKTTILRIIAGLAEADEGVIRCGDKTWTDTRAGICLPVQKRRVSMVFQDFTLFPHLSVYRNVCFAARDKHLPIELMKSFGIWHLRDSLPRCISGGERQRAAVCQALAREPVVLLMDEPFSALDPSTRRQLRTAVADMKGWLDIPIIHVTHDIREAMFLGDEILPVVEGKVYHKWLLQFMLTAREAGLCSERNTLDSEEEVELEPYDTRRRYSRG
ncbi:MAG: ATP-binding cassette domain-containing protein [Desulfomonilia bacterium]|jgi:molybdate transport system ATP-binding protein